MSQKILNLKKLNRKNHSKVKMKVVSVKMKDFKFKKNLWLNIVNKIQKILMKLKNIE